MDFDLTEEQVLFKDTVTRFMGDNYPFEGRQAIIDTPNGYSEEHWQTLAELGILALPLSEACGGLGGGAVETQLVMEQMGKALFAGPYVSSVLLACKVLEQAGDAEKASSALEGVIGGVRKLAFAYAERDGGYDIEATAPSGERKDNSYRMNGQKGHVFQAAT